MPKMGAGVKPPEGKSTMNRSSEPVKKILIAAIVSAVAIAPAVGALPGFGTLISHRGESIDAPENTLPAFRMAVERGFGFECDIYLSKDGRVFTFHDRTLKRTTGGRNNNACSNVTWDVISQLDVGSWGDWEGSRFAGTRPALLEEVLELARDGRYIYIEIKTGPDIVPYIKKAFARQKKANPGNVLFISFNARSCKALKELMPEYKVYWLTAAKAVYLDDDLESPTGKKAEFVTPEYVLDILKRTGADGVDMQFNWNVVTAEFMKKVKDAGYSFHVWTIDDISRTVEAFRRGADTLTTNRARDLRLEFHDLIKWAKSVEIDPES